MNLLSVSADAKTSKGEQAMRNKRSGVEHLAKHPGWRTTHKKPKPFVIVSTGDCGGVEVFQVVRGRAKPIESFVLDWDWFNNDPVEFFQNLQRNPIALKYVQTRLPEDWKDIQARVKVFGGSGRTDVQNT